MRVWRDLEDEGVGETAREGEEDLEDEVKREAEMERKDVDGRLLNQQERKSKWKKTEGS